MAKRGAKRRAAGPSAIGNRQSAVGGRHINRQSAIASRHSAEPYLPTADCRLPADSTMGVRDNIRSMSGYVPGEQPRDGDYIKLNTNENPYPPSPRVFEAIRQRLTGERLRKYPDPVGSAFRQIAGRVLGVD